MLETYRDAGVGGKDFLPFKMAAIMSVEQAD